MNGPDKLILNQIPSEHLRMGRALITTASICIDYRLNEALGTNISACHQRNSAKLGKLCSENGGLYIKAAQHLASMDHLLPKSYIEELARLQDQAPVSPMEVVEKVFRDEIGLEMNQVFSDICDIPIGSASIGQVHLAKLRSNGEKVALKIQHPNIKSDAEVDLKAFRLALKIVKFLFPTFNLDWIVEEVRECLDAELNFVLEAENSKKAQAAFAKDPKFSDLVLIPKVYDELTSARVLTMQFVPGFKINDVARMTSSNVNLEEVNKLMYEVFMEMIFKHGFVHCDPHPGNVLVNYDKKSKKVRIVLLDHGIYKDVPSEIAMKFSRLLLAILGKDHKEITKIAVELNVSLDVLQEFRGFVQTMTENLRKGHSQGHLNNIFREEIAIFLQKQPEDSKRQASEALQSLPREMLFIIKILDLLRSNERTLKANEKGKYIVPQSLMIITNYCVAKVGGQDFFNGFMLTYFKLLKGLTSTK